MKSELIKSKAAGNVWMLLVLFLLPGITLGQTPPLPGGSGSNGGGPDSPLAVPFDSHMAILLLLAGTIFAVSVILKLQKDKVAKDR